MKKLATVLGVMLLVVVMTVPVFARGSKWEKDPGMKPGRNMESCAVFNLNLTTEQSEKIRSFRETHLKEVMPLRNQLFGKRAELRLLWVQINPDKSKIVSMQKEISDLQYRIREKKTSYRLEIRKILTPEQQAKLILIRSGKGKSSGTGMGGNQHHKSGLMGWR